MFSAYRVPPMPKGVAIDPNYEKFLEEFDRYKEEQEKLRIEAEELRKKTLIPLDGESLAAQRLQEKIRRKALRKKRQMSKREWKEREASAKFIILEFISLYKETGQKRFLKKLSFYQRFMTDEQKSFVRAALQPEFGV